MTWIIQPVVYPSICITPLHIFFSPQAICRFLLLSALLQLHQCWEKRENRMGQGACPCPMRGTINQSFSISQTNPYSAEVSAAAGVSVGSAADTLAVPVLEYLVKSMCITTTTVSVAWKPIELSKSIVTGTA